MTDQPNKPVQLYQVSVTRLSPDDSHVTYTVTNVERGRMAEVAGKVEQQMITDGLRAMPRGGSGYPSKPKPMGIIHYDTQKGKITIKIPYRGKWDNDKEIRNKNQREYSDGVLKKLFDATKQKSQRIVVELEGNKKDYFESYTPNFARMIAQALPTDEFEQTDAFKQLLETQA
jgi:hypothetical protein